MQFTENHKRVTELNLVLRVMGLDAYCRVCMSDEAFVVST